MALPADGRTRERGAGSHHILLLLCKRAEPVSDLGIHRGGDRRFRHELRHMVKIVHLVAGSIGVVALFAVKLGDERVIIGGCRRILVGLFAAGGKAQQQKRCKQRGNDSFHRFSLSPSQRLTRNIRVFSVIIADIRKIATAFCTLPVPAD